MSLDLIKNNFEEAKQILDQFLSDAENFDRINEASGLMLDAIKKGRKIISCGNGGSMCDAMHFAEELTGRFRDDRPSLPAISISDPSHITCVGNDYGFDQIFAKFVEGVGFEGDVLLAISTSGNSKNVIQAAHSARKKGIKVVALTGKDGGELANNCDVEIRAPYSKYADRVQEVHIKVIHSLIHSIESNLK